MLYRRSVAGAQQIGNFESIMAMAIKPTPSAGTAPVKLGYFVESQLPIYSAWLVLPFLLIYEIGLIVMPSDVINGGEAIVKKLGAPIVRSLGVSGGLVSVIFIVAAFGIWQYCRGKKWTIHAPVLAGMFIESLFFAIVLFQILSFFAQSVSPNPGVPTTGRHASVERHAPKASAAAGAVPRMAVPVPCGGRAGTEAGVELRDFVLYCGAGVYEELVFRAFLLGLLMLVLTRLLHMEHAYAAMWSVAIGATIFAAFHHLGEIGDKFEVNIFLQRLIAGLYFSALFYNRSFGIAAASHAMYDILVGLNRLG